MLSSTNTGNVGGRRDGSVLAIKQAGPSVGHPRAEVLVVDLPVECITSSSLGGLEANEERGSKILPTDQQASPGKAGAKAGQ